MRREAVANWFWSIVQSAVIFSPSTEVIKLLILSVDSIASCVSRKVRFQISVFSLFATFFLVTKRIKIKSSPIMLLQLKDWTDMLQLLQMFSCNNIAENCYFIDSTQCKTGIGWSAHRWATPLHRHNKISFYCCVITWHIMSFDKSLKLSALELYNKLNA